MKILMIASYLPYPLFSGGQIRLYNLIKELSLHHEITLICEKRPHQTEADSKAVEKICKEVITVERKPQWSIKNIIQSGFSSHSFLVTGHTNASMKKEIKEVLRKETFDVIHVETFYVMQNLPHTTLPIVLAEHNIEYEVYERFIHQSPGLVRNLLAIDVKKIKREEENSWNKATALIAVSQEDKKIMEASGTEPSVVANGVNTDQFSFKKKQMKSEKKLLFIGDFKWIQNRDTVTFIIRNIWPLLREKEQLKLWVVGRNIPDSLKNLTSDSHVLFDEKSSDKPTQEIFQAATLLLAPIRVGGGTSYKILEAMSCGTPVVTMPLSAEAIGAKDGDSIMVGSSAEELATKTISLLENDALFEKVSKNARRLIEEKYTWKEIAKELENVYKNSV